MLKARIAVLVSGGGTNLQALIDAHARGEIPAGDIALVLASNPDAYALARAKNAGITAKFADRKSCASAGEFEERILSILAEHDIDVIVLAGFMYILSGNFIGRYRDRIINVHPSLIPSFCGEGFYGLRVHKAVLDYGVKVTGATVHLVNEVPDGGEILLQRAVDVLEDDTPQTLQRRVMEEAEWILLPKATQLLCALSLRSSK